MARASDVCVRYHALAADYDGTLAHHGKIDESTWAALRRLRESGRQLILVTGRQLDDLFTVMDHPELFDRIVAENGALIYQPDGKRIRTLAPAPPPRFAEELRKRGVDNVACGRVIVATWEPHEDTVLHVIHELGLELQVIFNKGAVMVLPTGVNKATGLRAALCELGLSVHNVVAVGDAENDHALLAMAECGVAVANALDVLKEHADIVTGGDHGRGVAELIDRLTGDDLAAAAPKLRRHHIRLGRTGESDVTVDPYSANVLVCGTSGGGKSTVVTWFLEQLAEAGYQYAIIDPEGDFITLEDAVVIGGSDGPPRLEEVLDVLKDPSRNVVIDMLGVALEHRPEVFAKLLPALATLRARTGRPHWVVVDEAHHLLPVAYAPAGETIATRPRGIAYITVHPDAVAPAVLHAVHDVLIVGGHPHDTLRAFCTAVQLPMPRAPQLDKLPAGQVLWWRVGAHSAVELRCELPKNERTRHSRKYTEGNLGRDRSFYFRGPAAKLNLKAHNLQMFVQIAEGVDDDTWLYHLGHHDYSTWLRHEVKDAELADEVHQVELASDLAPADSRAQIRAAIEKRYTLPADAPTGVVDPEDDAARRAALG
jgi:HAD superfamily hydrolase (TIGR01484 family)